MSKPRVTIIIPAYNAGSFLRPSVESILGQTHGNLEVFVVDDGSTDGSIETLQGISDPRLKVIRQKNGGKSSAINHGFRLMSGDYWGIQDADDISHPERIERQVNALLEDATLAAVFTGNDLIIDGQVIAPRLQGKSPQECKAFIERCNLPAHDATGLYRVSMVKGMEFDLALRIGQGVDYILRVGEMHPIKVLDGCFYSHRMHSTSTTHKDPRRNNELINLVMRKACERRGFPPDKFAIPFREERRFFKHRDIDSFMTYVIDSLADAKNRGLWSQAVRTVMFCIKRHPFDPFFYKPLVYFLTPMFLISARRRARAGN